MRLCLVSETWAPEINGVAHTLNHLSQELDQRGVEQQLIRPRPRQGQGARFMQAELHVSGFRLPRYTDVQFGWPADRRIMEFWRLHRPDVVYLATEGPLGFSALRVARRLGIPTVSGFHTNFDHYAGDYGMNWLKAPVLALLRRFHNRTHATLVPTAVQAERLQEQGFVNVRVMGRGIDSQHFTPEKRDPALRRQWGAEGHQPVALHVGRLACEKNLDLLVETFRSMREARPDLILVLVGDGPQRASLQQRLPEAIFTGFIDHYALARHYASADLFIFPSLSETYGNVVVEAMASALGVLAFDYAAAEELIDNQRNGVLIPRNAPEDFVQAAVSLCQSPARFGQMGRAACMKIQSQGWDAIADTFIDSLRHAQEPSDGLSDPCRP